MVLPLSAVRHYKQQQAITAEAVTETDRLWKTMTDDFDLSWSRIAEESFVVAVAAQQAAAVTGIQYVPTVLAELNDPADVVADVNPARFGGGTRDGRPLETLMHGAVYKSKQAVGAGADVREALAVGGMFLADAITDAIREANRGAVAAAITTRPTLTGWVRMLNPPSCKFCIVLAGKWYRWNQGFDSHPDCFPAGVVVSGPSADAASRRWYEGELIILHTASGQRLPVTGNHPILTDHGWVPANLLDEGHSVVRSVLGEGALPLVVPDEKQGPALIEDVWGSDRMGGLSRVKTSPEDFHGDGMHGEVDIVFADRDLRSGLMPASGEPVEHDLFATGVDAGSPLPAFGVGKSLGVGQGHTSQGVMGGGGLGCAFGAGHFVGADIASGGVTSDWYASLDESSAQHVAVHAEFFAEAVLALTTRVLRRDEVDGQDEVSPRWDAPSVPLSVESRGAYAERGEDLRLRLSGQVELDRLVKVERVQWSGHVYNLTSSEGWYSANGLIVSNCDCRHIPASENVSGDLTTDPYAYFHGLSEVEQNRLFNKNDAQAIRDGGDIYRVVNIRGRGLADDVMKNTGGRNRGWQARRWNTPSKITVDDIYAATSSRGEAIQMLKDNGFITGEQIAGGNLKGNTPSEFGNLAAGAMGRGGARRGATSAYRKAVNSGVRDPLEPATQTAAERRLHRAVLVKQAADRGSNPFGRSRMTEADRVLADRMYERELSKLDEAPEQVRFLARLLGIL